MQIPNWLKNQIVNWLKNPLIPLLVLLLVGLVAAFVGVMSSKCAQEWIGGLLGISKDNKNEILKFLGFGMGGVLLVIQATLSHKRAKAMEDATNEQAKANENSEKGLRQERLKNAIEHLGHDSDSVRLGGAYELFHLAEETKELRQTAFDMLCVYIRRVTGEDKYREMYKLKPSEEIQSLLTLLFVQEHKVFKGLHINLQGSWLNGAALPSAHLEGANLSLAVMHRANLQGAHLQEANLMGVQLQSARLMNAQLQSARFWRAELQGARLMSAQLQSARFGRAQLQGANLVKAQLQKAYLRNAQLQGANLREAHLQGANLLDASLQSARFGRAQLQGAYLEGARLQGAYLGKAQLQGVDLCDAQLQGVNLQGCLLQGVISNETEPPSGFIERIRGSIGRQSDLSGIIFVGGLEPEDLDTLLEGLSDEGTERLLKTLEPHIGQPASHELPKNSGAITGTYTAKEAEKWFAEYEKATSETSADESS